MPHSKMCLEALCCVATYLCCVTVSHAQQIAQVYDGQAYDAAGTLIGPFEYSPEQKVQILRSFVGTRGKLRLRDGSVSQLVRIVRLMPDSFGHLDSIRIRSGLFDKNLPISEIASINAGGRVVSLASSRRRELKLYEINIPRELHLLNSKSETLRSRELNVEMREEKWQRFKESVERQFAEVKDVRTKFEQMKQQTLAGIDSRKKTLDQREGVITKQQRVIEQRDKDSGDREIRTRQQLAAAAKKFDDATKVAGQLKVKERELNKLQDSLRQEQGDLAKNERNLNQREATLARTQVALELERTYQAFVSGILFDANDAPVRNVRITLYTLDPDNNEQVKSEVVTTDDLGKFASRKVSSNSLSKVSYNDKPCSMITVPGLNVVEIRLPRP